VGGYLDTSRMSHGFLLDKGNFTTLDPPGAPFTEALGIGASGNIVGHYASTNGNQGFLLNKGAFTTISVPGSASTRAFGINATGQRSWAITSSGARSMAFC